MKKRAPDGGSGKIHPLAVKPAPESLVVNMPKAIDGIKVVIDQGWLAARTLSMMDTIEIRIRGLAQLFDALDPAPLQARTLDRSAESYILACARKHRPTDPLRLLVHLPESLRAHAADATDAIHEHFRRAHAQGERNFRRRMRIGGFALVAASGVLAASFGLRSLLSNVEGQALVEGLGEGLLILGWVAMWRPVEILLFEHWESHLDHAVLERLATIPIEFVSQPDAARQASPDLQDDR